MYSIIVPAYNEERRIKNTLIDYYEYFKSKKEPFEIIVVFDGEDSTGKIVKDLSKRRKNIILIEFSHRLGKGGAIIEGFKKAKGDILGFTDADESVRPHDFYKLIENLGDAECCIASRHIKGSRILLDAPFSRKCLSFTFRIVINASFFLGIKDTQCGAKVFKKALIKKILHKVKSRGFEFDAELLWRIKKDEYKIRQVPVNWYSRAYSSVNLNSILKMLINLMQLRLGVRRVLW
jgi:glycosyltransferase involved in cell wall biosynthesis